MLIFFLVLVFFNGISAGGTLFSKLLISLVFGLILMLVPAILGFFKITVNAGSIFLLTLVLSLIFFFVLDTGFLGGSVGRTEIAFGLPGFSSLVLDTTGTIVVVSIVSALMSALLDKLAGTKH